MKKCFSLFLSTIFILQLIITANAKTVTKENEDVTPVFSATTTSKTNATKPKLPIEIKAKSAILMDVTTGKVLLEYNADEKLFPASVTKIMTMLLVVEAIQEGKISLTDVVVCSENASKKGGSQIWLEPGEEMTVNDLLKATAIGSANDAATLLGEYISGSEEAFISLMNERAKELGMNNTHFENATGLDDTTDTHLTTARDIGIMSVELMKHDLITDYTTVWMDSLRNGETELVNTNKLVRFYSGTTGIKTGTTNKAGCCVSASAKRVNLHLVAVVMGSGNSNERFETAKTMLNYGFANFTVVELKIDEIAFKDVEVIGGEAKSVMPYIKGDTTILLKKGDAEKLEQTVTLTENVQSPVDKNQKLGSVKFTLAGECVAEFPLLAKNEVKKLTFSTSLKRILNFLACGEKIG
ncbi:MAG: D-alanyl-D-alanine carboxypeptidase [Clostridia bacterium]|nr:D-alanyl-D-alanine carboxypeptidase [Clostridia bacterium]